MSSYFSIPSGSEPLAAPTVQTSGALTVWVDMACKICPDDGAGRSPQKWVSVRPPRGSRFFSRSRDLAAGPDTGRKQLLDASAQSVVLPANERPGKRLGVQAGPSSASARRHRLTGNREIAKSSKSGSVGSDNQRPARPASRISRSGRIARSGAGASSLPAANSPSSASDQPYQRATFSPGADGQPSAGASAYLGVRRPASAPAPPFFSKKSPPAKNRPEPWRGLKLGVFAHHAFQTGG